MLPRIYRTETEIRKQQINTLKVFNDNVTEVKEGSEYQVSFNAAGNDFLLLVSLTNKFPNEKPILKIVPTIKHAWINSDGEVTAAPGLLNFTVHSDLGRVVQAIIREFERNPPQLASEAGSSRTSPCVPIKSPTYSLHYGANQNFSPPSQSIIPNFTQNLAFPELNSLELEELRFIYENDDRQEEFIESLPQVRETNKFLDDFVNQIETIAEDNLSREERLSQLREDIRVRIEEVTELALENEKLIGVYQSLSDKYSPKNIKEQLCAAVETAEDESEQIAKDFLDGNVQLNDFVSMYLEKRTLCHNRKTKEEKLTEQLHNLEKAGF